jgi:hypothetical protein
VYWTGRCGVRELADGVGDPAPDRYAVVILGGGKLIGARGAFLEAVSAVNPEAIGEKPRTLAAVCGWLGT